MARLRKIKLQPSLVPAPLWGISVHRALGRGKAWKAIRKDTLDAAGHRCVICGAREPPLICHEVWGYDEKRGIATLSRFESHCRDCDMVTHIGRSTQLGLKDRALNQLCHVNGITCSRAKRIVEEAFALWERRNRKKWHIRVHKSLIKLYPELQDGLSQVESFWERR